MNKNSIVIIGCVLLTYVQGSAQPPSLANCGNTCFINASLQMLLNVNPLCDLLKDAPPVDPQYAHTAADYFINLVKEWKRGTPNFTCTSNKLQSLTDTAYDLLGAPRCSQQDGPEFLNALINQLYESLRTVAPELSVQIETLFFTGEKSVITCPATALQPTAQKFEHAYIVSIPIDQEKSKTLYDCLDAFFKKETNVTYQGRTDCAKQMFISTYPPYLCISLNRYAFVGQKIEKSIQIPQLLQMPVHNPLYMYELIGAVIHKGSYGGGHYIAYVKDVNNIWYLCNDSIITKIGTTLTPPVQNDINTGYVFLYKQRSAQPQPPPTSVINALNQYTAALDNLARTVAP